MSTKSSAESIAKFCFQDSGQAIPLTKDDEEIVAKYSQWRNNQPEEATYLAFKNVVVSGESCGFANAGKQQYLLNTDRNNGYLVTVRMRWEEGLNRGESDRVIPMNAGEKKPLGCSDSGSIPVVRFWWSVVGEEKR